MSKPIINIDQVDFKPWGHGEYFQALMGSVSSRIGASKLGYGITLLAPGKCAFPFHNHRVNEELFFILEGTGEVRFGDTVYPLRQGDFIACPPGGRELAHQIRNTSTADLRYLAIATNQSPEIAEYPDSNKTGVFAQFKVDDQHSEQMRFICRDQASIDDYWADETTA